MGGIIHSPFIKLSPIFSEAHVAVCCPTHSMAGKTVSLSEFISHNHCYVERNSGAFVHSNLLFFPAGISIEPAWESSYPKKALLEATYLNLDVTILPENFAKRSFQKINWLKFISQIFLFKTTVCLAIIKTSLSHLQCKFYKSSFFNKIKPQWGFYYFNLSLRLTLRTIPLGRNPSKNIPK